MNRFVTIACVVAAVVACSSGADQKPPAESTAAQRSPNTDSVRAFARGFYDWYTALALADVPGSTIDSALKARPAAFDSVLVRELTEDAAAQAKANGELVGLTFDPVLASQDPCPRYEVGYIEVVVAAYHVHINATCDRAAGPVPSIVAEVAASPSGFVFVNFRYPSTKTDLRTELATLRATRSRK